MTFINYQWGNRCSDLSYSLAGNGSFVSGIESNRVASIVDLGTANDLRARYGFDDADGGGVGFASLRLEGDKITVLRDVCASPDERLEQVALAYLEEAVGARLQSGVALP